MSRLKTNGTLLTELNNNTPFIYAHLVKFERPVEELISNNKIIVDSDGDKFAYLTDAGYDIVFDDGTKNLAGTANGNRTYTANKLLKVGSTTESTQIKVASMNIELDATAIDAQVASNFTVTSTQIMGQKGVDLVLAGFKVGDKVRFTDNPSSELIITGFLGDGQGGIPGNINARATYTLLKGTQASFSQTNKTLTLVSEEVKFLTTDVQSTGYINRRVTVYKAFFYADSPHLFMGSPIKVFEGIITNGSYKEGSGKASISWSLKSHWGDFEQVRGRITSADVHQAYDEKGIPSPASTLKPEYADDYGFAHSETALNVIATYTDTEKYLKEKKKKKWYGSTKYKYQELERDITRETDIRFDLQARRIPIVYGVQRIKPIPVFADIGASSSTNNHVFVAHALSEGPIQSVMNLYVDDMPLVCVDAADFSARAGGGEAVDISCVGRTDSGVVLEGSASGTDPLTYLSSAAYSRISERENALASYASVSVSGNSAGTYATPSTGLRSGDKGLFHEQVIKGSEPMPYHMEFHSGFTEQKNSSLISTQANSPGKKFRIQQDYWDAGDSGIEYWGPQHKLADTAYAACRFELSPDQTQVPSIEYVIKGKLVECYNYDGSYNHNTLATFAGEAITNFTEGQLVDFKTARTFTASADTGAFAGVHNANSKMFDARIIDIFYFIDAKGQTNWRMRWNLTGDAQDLLNEAKDFYIEFGGNQWHMITYDATVDLDTSFTVAEVLTTTVSTPTTTGSTPLAAATSNRSTNFVNAADNAALYRWLNLIGDIGEGSSAFNVSQQLAGNYSGDTLTFPEINSTYTPTYTTVIITNKLKLSSNASSADDYYNGLTLRITKTLSNGDQAVSTCEIEDYDGSSRIVTVADEITKDFIPAVGDKVEILFGKDVVSTSDGADLRPTINFAVMLLDYLNSRTYGPGIDMTKIDLDTFRLAAQLCDTQSEVTITFAGSQSLVVGSEYRYYSNGHEKWSGVVKSGSGSTWTFTDVSGKLTNKHNDWSYRNLGDIIWDPSTSQLYTITTAGVQSSFSNKASSTGASFNLTKIGGSGPANISVNADLNNPVAYSFYDSDDVKFWKYLGWESHSQRNVTRHQGNVKIDTNQTVFQVIQGLLTHFNGMLAFVDGKYRLTVETTRNAEELDDVFTDTVGGSNPTTTDIDIRARYITDEDIIGNITIKDEGLSKSFNSLSASIVDPQINFDSRSVSFFNSEYLKKDRGVIKSTNFTAGGISNYFNARMLVKQSLDKSRFNRKISFTMRPVGLSILPGELIRIEYERFGWTSSNPKLFRVETVTLKEDCLIALTAEEYDDSLYLIDPPRNSAFFIDNQQAATTRVPEAPTNVIITTNGPAGANVVSWTASEGVSTTEGDTGYEVWRATSLSGNPSTSVVSHATKLDFNASKNAYTDIGFTNTVSATYYYWVRAFNTTTVQATSGSERKTYFSPFNANSNYGDATDAAASGRAVADGISPISVSIEKAATLVECDSSGAIVLTGGAIADSSNKIEVFEGTTQLNFDGSGSSNGTFAVAITATNVTAGSIVDSGAFATINNATNMSQNVGSLVYNITGKTQTGTNFTVTRVQSFTKAIPGTQGSTVELTPSKYVINYSKSGGESDTIVFSAVPRNVDGVTPHYEFIVAGTIQQNYSTTSTYTLADNLEPATGASTLVVVNVKANGTGDVIAGDSVSIYGVQDGSDAAIGFLTNPSHAVPAGSDGTLGSSALNDADGTFKVFLGGVDITTNAAVTFASSGATGMAATLNANTGVYQCTALNADSGTITFTATIAANAALGTASSISIPQTFTMAKAKAGVQGQSITGATGPRTSGGLLYYSVAAASAPSAPSASSFVFSSAQFSSLTSGWQSNPPTFAGSNQNKYWYVPFTVVEASFGGTQTVTLGSVTQAIGFSGLVTFSNGNTFGDGTNAMSFGASGTTAINGGNITTGVINLGNSAGMAVRQGKTGYTSTTAGFWLGNDGGTPKFNIGTSSNYLKFDGSSLQVAGSLTITSSQISTALGYTPTDDTAAAAAQGTANTGVSNAAAAQGTANTGVSNAAAAQQTADSKITGSQVNANVTSIDGSSITTGFINANRIQAGSIVIGNLSGASTFKGGLSNLNNPGSAITPTDDTAAAAAQGTANTGVANAAAAQSTADSKITGAQVNTNVTSINGNVITTGTINAARISLVAGNIGGLGDAATASVSAIRSGTSKADVGLGQVDDDSTATIRATSAATAGTVGGWNLTSSQIYSGTASSSGYSSSGITLNSNGVLSAQSFYIDSSGNAFFKGSIAAEGLINGRRSDDVTGDADNAKWKISGTSTSYRAAVYSGSGGSGTTSPNSGEVITVTASNGSTTHTATCTFTVTTSSGAVAVSVVDSNNAFTGESSFTTFTGTSSTPTRVGTLVHSTGLKWSISYGQINVQAGNISCCFIGDTLVDMRDGSQKAIKDIELGDLVIVETGTAEVLELHPTILGNRKLYSINEGTAFVTSEHPFKTEEGWKSIDPEKTKEEREELYKELTGTLQVGDKVLKKDGLYHEITNISSIEGDFNTPLYNFTVGLDDHSYFADGYCVHNK